MKKILFSIIFLAGTVVFQSCSDEHIKPVPPDFSDASTAASLNTNILNMLNNIYAFVPKGFNRLDVNATTDDDPGTVPSNPSTSDPKTAMVASSTDEAVHATRASAAEQWGEGQWQSSPQNNWDTQIKTDYVGIRKTFEFTDDVLSKAKIDVGEITQATHDRYLGEALFLRALFNFELLKRYGGYPIVKGELSPADVINIPKSSYTDCVTYISGLCDQAASLLPLDYSGSITGDFGRATKGAALALKSRMLLYAASPLNNTTNDVTKWKAAADAAAAVIKLNAYSLMSGANGVGYTNAFLTFSGSNTELIFGRLEGKTSTLERMNGLPSITAGGGGLGGTCPSLNLVNDYETIDGKPFDWNNATMAANPFANRDPRFAASILYNGSTWMAATGGSNTTVQTYVGGKDQGVLYATRTGFYLRKFMVISATFGATPAGTANHFFPILRYAEVLLNYAEAMNEAYGPDADPNGVGLTARGAIKLIRTRAGLTANLDDAAATSVAAFRTAVQHERRIELAFEEHRGFDLRRWKLAETVLNQPIMGLNIVKTGTSTYTYTPQQVENRVFVSPKMYFYPFPQDELSRNPGLTQNPGW